MKAATKMMRQRLEALKLAEGLGNVSRVCRERGIPRTTQFYESANDSRNKALKA